MMDEIHEVVLNIVKKEKNYRLLINKKLKV